MEPRPRTIMLSNINEDVSGLVAAMNAQAQESDENNGLGERALFYVADRGGEALVVTPLPVPSAFVEYVRTLFPQTDFVVVSPKDLSLHDQFSQAVLQDPEVILQMTQFVRDALEITFEAYTASGHSYAILELLLQHRSDVRLMVPDRQNQTIVDMIGTKTGLRQRYLENVFQEHVVMAQGVVIERRHSVDGRSHIEKIAQFAAQFYSDSTGVVIKTEKGHAGVGVLLLPPHSLTGDPFDAICALLQAEPYWQQFDAIVEEFINTDPTVEGTGGGQPNAEFLVNDTGVSLLYVCGMRVHNGQFQGVEIGPGILNADIIEAMSRAGQTVGSYLREGGYRGHFDLDFMYGIDGQLYLAESNVRYTGGSHAYHAARELLGDTFAFKYIVTMNVFAHEALKPVSVDFMALQNMLEPVLYNTQTKTGLVIVSQSLLTDGKFGYMIIADEKDEALQIEATMVKLLDCSLIS